MNVVAIIPARGGSKGIPRKNLQRCGGRPLLAWSIEAGTRAQTIDRVWVSTEDPEIEQVAGAWGAGTIERPAELAIDTALTDPVLVHAVQWLEAAGDRPDLVVLLQPTVPIRRGGLVDECVLRLLESDADSLLTAYPLHFVWWRENGYEYDGDTGKPTSPAWRCQCPRRPRRQDMIARELMWHEDGSVFVTRTDLLLSTGKRLGGRMEVYETERSVDIDDERDLLIADALLTHGLRERACRGAA